MGKRGHIWIAVDVELLDPLGNRFGLDDAAILAFLRCIAWCRRQRSDGRLPAGTAAGLLNGAFEQLSTAGLVSVDNSTGAVDIPDYLKWNPSAAEIDARRKADRDRKEKGR